MVDIPAGFKVVSQGSPALPDGFRVVGQGTGNDSSQWERATILPMETNRVTGERRWAWPQLAVDIGQAVMAPGDALQGKFNDVYVDPQTYAVEPFNRDMMSRAATLAALPMLPEGAGVASTMPATARNLLATGLESGKVAPDSVGSLLKSLGPQGVVADLAPQLQKQAQALATMPGAAQKIVVDRLAGRAAGRNARIIAGVNDALGPPVVPSRLEGDIRAQMDALAPQYQTLFARDARAVDTKPIAEHLDQQIVNLRGDAQKAAKQVRQMLDITGAPDTLDPNPYTLFQTRQAIDGMLETEANSKVIAVLSEARKMVDAELAQKVPGIKAVDAQFAELARQKEALKTGQQLLDSGRTAIRPAELADMVTAGAAPQGMAVGPSAVPLRLSQGARAEIERLIGTTANDFTALKTALKGDGSWNRDRLVTLYGQEKADKLLSILDRESKFIETEQPALGGSRTQILKAAQDQINGTEPKASVFQNIADIKPGSAARIAMDKGVGWVFKANRDRNNSALARLLMAGPGDTSLLQGIRYAPGPIMANAPQAAARTGLAERERYQVLVRAMLKQLTGQ